MYELGIRNKIVHIKSQYLFYYVTVNYKYIGKSMIVAIRVVGM